jgi:dTDP-4-amino-4,6-dideoxygalactose transaminase
MIKFLDLKAINASFEPEFSQAVQRVLDSGWYLLGNETACFEKEYARYIGTKHCIGVANGLDALRLILKAYIQTGKMSEGDEIIVPANTYVASILAITDNRLVPVLVEPDIHTYNMDPFLIEDKITPRTKGIMLVHLYGRCAMHPEIKRLIEKYNLYLIEDNAQAAGTFYVPPLYVGGATNQHTGSLGHAAGHSFYPGKNIGCIGDGGAVTTNDDELETVIRSLGNYGSAKKYVNDFKGLNSRLDEIQAAVLRVKLKRLDDDNNRRRAIAAYYCKHIQHPEIVLPAENNEALKDKGHVWHVFVIRCRQQEKLQKYLSANDIQTLIHYPIPPHKQKAYKEWNHMSFPVTEKIHAEVLSLPMSPLLTLSESEMISQAVNLFENK